MVDKSTVPLRTGKKFTETISRYSGNKPDYHQSANSKTNSSIIRYLLESRGASARWLSDSPLHRFHARKQHDDATGILEMARTAPAQCSVTKEFLVGSGRLLPEKAFELIGSGVKPKQFNAVYAVAEVDHSPLGPGIKKWKRSVSLLSALLWNATAPCFTPPLKKLQSPTEHQETLLNAVGERCFDTETEHFTIR